MKKTILFTALIAICLSAYSQDSLTYYLSLAAKNNPTVLQRYNEYQAALQKVPQVGGLPDPSLNLGFFLKPMELPGGNQVADLQLMQMFPWFGVLKNAKDEMSLMAKASLASVQEAKLEIYFDVRTSWYALYQNREQLRITQQNLDLLKQLEQLALSRYRSGASIGIGTASNSSPMPAKAGPSANGMSTMGGNSPAPTASAAPMVSPSMTGTSNGGLAEIYALQVQEQELANNLETLNDAFTNLQFKFNKLLNRSVESSIVLPEKVEDTFQPPMDSALQNNPMLLMIGFEKESLAARRKMSDKMAYPMVGVGLKYSVLSKNPSSTSMMNGQDMLMPMLSVSLPIYRKKYKGVQQENVWLQTATEQRCQATKNQLQSDYQDALLNFRDAERRLKLYERQRELTETTYQLQLKRFAASTGNLSDLQSLSRQLLEYSQKSLDARIELLLAQAKIRQLTAQD